MHSPHRPSSLVLTSRGAFAKMGNTTQTEAGMYSPALSSTESFRSPLSGLGMLPQTPPDSAAGSPPVKVLDHVVASNPPHSPLPPILEPFRTEGSREILPSIQMFDQQIEEMILKHGLPQPQRQSNYFITPSHVQPSQSRAKLSRLRSEAFSRHLTLSPAPFHYSHNGEFPPPLSPEAEGRHINQKYTTEEGDYIIYAWHDKKMKWARIKDEFAAMFGNTPERTVQGLQAWYYRMNKEIPVWTDDGWLIFEKEDDVEPKCVSIKRRQREVKCQMCKKAESRRVEGKQSDRESSFWLEEEAAAREAACQCKQMGPLGLAQRYPERLMHYAWVDPELKRQARDWAHKRTMQYNDRRARRRHKEMRRANKL